MKTSFLAICVVVLLATGCYTKTEKTVEKTKDANGNEQVTTTTVTTHTGLNEDRIDSTSEKAEQKIEQGYKKAKEEYKETRSKIKTHHTPDTIIVKKKK